MLPPLPGPFVPASLATARAQPQAQLAAPLPTATTEARGDPPRGTSVAPPLVGPPPTFEITLLEHLRTAEAMIADDTASPADADTRAPLDGDAPTA